MSEIRRKAIRSGTLSAARLALFAGSAVLALCAAHNTAQAQISGNLRGPVEDEDINERLLNRSPLSSRRGQNEELTPEYVPLLEGAVADDNTQDPASPIAVEAPRGLDTPRRTSSGALPDNEGNESDTNRASAFDDLDAADDPLSARERRQREETDDDEASSTIRRADTVDASDTAANQRARVTNERTGSIEGGNLDPEDDPYAPLGLRIGTFDVTTSLETGLRVTDNIDSSPGGTEGVLSETTLRLNAASDWSRHSATLDASFTHLEAISGGNYSEPSANIDAALTLEMGSEYQINAAAGYDLNRESAVGPANTVSQSLHHVIDGSLGFEKSAGKYRFAITGAAEREQFTGGAIPQTDRNATLLTATLRTGYEISPALVPFVEGEIGRRIYDEKIDQNGFARSSDRLALRAGAEFDFGEKLTGELAAGWLREAIEDPALADVSGVSVNGTVNWSPSRETTLALNASTTVESTTTAGSSGSILYTADATLTRQIRANLETSLSAGGYYRDFSNTSAWDQSLTASAAFTWWLNRTFGLTGRVSHETVLSSDPTREYSTNSAFLGVKIQR